VIVCRAPRENGMSVTTDKLLHVVVPPCDKVSAKRPFLPKRRPRPDTFCETRCNSWGSAPDPGVLDAKGLAILLQQRDTAGSLLRRVLQEALERMLRLCGAETRGGHETSGRAVVQKGRIVKLHRPVPRMVGAAAPEVLMPHSDDQGAFVSPRCYALDSLNLASDDDNGFIEIIHGRADVMRDQV
jgi:hypothetical protein